MDDDRDFLFVPPFFRAQMGAQNRQIILFVYNCAAHPKDTPFLRNVTVVRYPANCTSTLQPLDLGIIQSLKAYYRKTLCANIHLPYGVAKGSKEKNFTYSKQCTT